MAAKRDTNAGWIGVDLDGTLANDSGYKGPEHIGEPVPAMVAKVREFLNDGHNVKLFTARTTHFPVIRRWMKTHLGEVLPITNIKDPGMIALFDDRVVGVRRNEGKVFHEDNEKQVFDKS